jgi:hypothetical protein
MRPPATTFSLNGNMPGRRCLSASAASGTRWPTTRGDPTARKAPTRSCAIVANALSRSSRPRAGTIRSSSASFSPAFSIAGKAREWDGVVAFHRTPIRRVCGRALLTELAAKGLEMMAEASTCP